MLGRPESISEGVLSRVETQKQLHFTIEDVSAKKKEVSGLALANIRRAERGAGLFGGKSMGVIARRQSVQAQAQRPHSHK